MLTVFHPMGYNPLRVIMKARDVQSGFVYTVNPGSDYGFNYRHATGFNTTQSRNIEVAIGSAGLFLTTNSGSRRNVLTGQRRGRFNIYAILEFITSPPPVICHRMRYGRVTPTLTIHLIFNNPVSRAEQRVHEQKPPVAAQRVGAPQRPVQPPLLAPPCAAPEEAHALNHAAAQPIRGDQRRRNAYNSVCFRARV